VNQLETYWGRGTPSRSSFLSPASGPGRFDSCTPVLLSYAGFGVCFTGGMYLSPARRRSVLLSRHRPKDTPRQTEGAQRVHPRPGKPTRGCREGWSAYRSRVCRAARQDRKSTDGPGSDARFWSASRLTSWPRPNKESSWPRLNWSEWAGITCPLSHLSPNPRACRPPRPLPKRSRHECLHLLCIVPDCTILAKPDFLWRWRRGFALARPRQVRVLCVSFHLSTLAFVPLWGCSHTGFCLVRCSV
jgi:hypothetical protein